MKSYNRRGIELATNTIVVLIVAVIILVMATTMTYQAYCSAEGLSQEIDSSTANRIEQLLAGGAKVEVADNTQEAKIEGSPLCGSSRLRVAEFTLGLKNTKNSQLVLDVTIERSVPETPYTEETIQFFTDQPGKIVLEPYETRAVAVLITLPVAAEQTQHVYTVQAREGEILYGAQQVYVSIP